jgi:hypothetical protein
MRRWTLSAAACALLSAALWHLPATAQHTGPGQTPPPVRAQPAAGTADDATTPQRVTPRTITFEEYRDFRMHDIAQRRARLAQALKAPDLSPADKESLEARKAYYDRLVAMPAAERDRLFRARFDQIDTDHDGVIDENERAAWREKQRERYRELAAQRTQTETNPH